ncbi:MAG TPA: cytochrome c maturation protein CcmE [Spirochaetota bacterium]|nr:cytochrome c maturation protein CcmE [Spirochaetota bacterium]HPS85818.1 cytochrome c maturation protein CcmE [Spirochaetota bacterium]
MKNKKILVFIAALILLVTAILSLSDDLFSPYVTFQYAEKHPGKYVQIIGKRAKDTEVTHSAAGFTFTLIDESGSRLTIFHNGVKPQNFEHTEQVVVLGKYSSDKTIFEADKVLVKCPSKYEKEKNK